MACGTATRGRTNPKRNAGFVRFACVLSLVTAAWGCSSNDDGNKTAETGGAVASGGSTGGGLQGGTGGAGATSGTGGATGGLGGATGGGPGSGGTASGGIGPSGGSPSGGAASGGIGPSGGGPGSGGTTGGGPGTGGGTTGGGPGTGGIGGGLGGGTTGGGPGTGGAAGAGGDASGGAGPCDHECLDECVDWGGTEQPGVCEGGKTCCEGATPPADPLADLVASAETTGLLLAQRFSRQQLSFSSVANLPGDGYKTACEWYGSLAVANLTDNQTLLDSLVTKFDPLKNNFVNAMTGGEAHVDRYIFGMVPLEIYIQTGDESYLPLGLQVADRQQTTNQTRDAIDDMFMMTGLQLEAYRAAPEADKDKYIDFMAPIMVRYLGAQQSNGLFFHNVNEARVHWGRGNGWFAAGMAEMLRDLPESHANYQAILDGYKKMMDGLRQVQGPHGLWYQVLNLPNDSANWEESSGSAMFTYAMIAGVRRGILDADTYVPVIQDAWAGLQSKINAQGDVADICTGTWYHSTPQEYMALTRLTGDGHGQAPVLWAAAELLRVP